jgi:hypothetical protein
LENHVASEPIVSAMSKAQLIVGGAIAGVTISVLLLAVAFATHSMWPIIPGVYAVAMVVGIHSLSMAAVAVINAILLWIPATLFLKLYWRRSNR